jgi:predicted transcriptional regulator
MGKDDAEKRMILRFLGDTFTNSPDNTTSYKVIAKNCGLEEGQAKSICLYLEGEGFIQNDKRSGDHSYKITTNGLILLEGYSTGTEGTATKLSQINKLIKSGLDRIKTTNAEVQTGIVDAGRKYHLRDGLFYIVLVDLAGSTLASSRMNSIAFNEWIKKFLQITKEALSSKTRNLAVYVKSVGDGALFLFRNFDDILEWKNKVDELCNMHNDKCRTEGKLDFYQYRHKTIIHLSDVYFDSTNSDVNAFGVNLIFKLEKKFGKDDIGITDAVKQIILQDINSGKFRINEIESYSLDEDGNYKIPLWKLIPIQ